MSLDNACSAACGWCGACTDGPRTNATCPRCRRDYYCPRDEWTIGALCDACCVARDIEAEQRRA